MISCIHDAAVGGNFDLENRYNAISTCRGSFEREDGRDFK
jgi:hypothetical protein